MKDIKDEEKDLKLSIRVTPEELKQVKRFVLDNDTSIQAFGYHAVFHAMKNKILPVDKK